MAGSHSQDIGYDTMGPASTFRPAQSRAGLWEVTQELRGFFSLSHAHNMCISDNKSGQSGTDTSLPAQTRACPGWLQAALSSQAGASLLRSPGGKQQGRALLLPHAFGKALIAAGGQSVGLCTAPVAGRHQHLNSNVNCRGGH